MLSNPKEISEFWQVFDRGMSWWKSWTLLGVMAYHSRNFVSDQWLAFLGGMRSPAAHFKAGQIMMTASTQGGRHNRPLQLATKAFGEGGQIQEDLFKIVLSDRFGNTIMDGQTAWDSARAQGVLGGGWQADVVEGLDRESILWQGMNFKNPASVLRTMVSRRSPYLRAMGKLNEYVTNQTRFALYIDRLQKGDDVVQAANHVRKYLFDYAEISEFDRIIRRAMPFWMWSKHNIPLAIETMLKQPEKYLAVIRAKKALESGVGPESEQARADWIKKLYGVAIRKNKKTGEVEYFMLRSWWPGSDLLELTSPLETVFANMNPWMRSPIETVFNQRQFFESPISRYPGQEGRIGLPGGGELTVPSFLGMDGRKWEHLIRDFLPLRLYTEMVERVGANIPGIPREEVAATRGGVSRRLATALFGLKTAKTDPDQVRRQRIQELERLRRNARAVYKGRIRRNDNKGARSTMRNYERKARELQRALEGSPRN